MKMAIPSVYVLMRFSANQNTRLAKAESLIMRFLQRLTSSLTSKRAVGATSVSDSRRCPLDAALQ